MAPLPQGRSARRRLTAALVCAAVVIGLFPAAACAPRQSGTEQEAAAADPDPSISAAPETTPTSPANRSRLGGRTPVVSLETEGTYSWAFLDRATGMRYQSENASDTASTESMIKAWLAADYMSRNAEPDYDLLVPMILDSDDDAAETIYWDNGGDASIYRMIDTCGLVDTEVDSGWWSLTQMSARDAVTLGECLATGAASTEEGTEWLLQEMREVRGEGRFGVVDAVNDRVAARISIKNGWTLHSDEGIWQVNCLAIHPKWVMAIMTTYSWDLGLEHGSEICADITRQILNPTP